VRLALAGYNTDVLPEYLHYYRQTGDGLSRSCDPVPSTLRMIEAYDGPLAAAGIPGSAAALCALYGLREREARDVDPVKGIPRRLPVLKPFHDDLSGLARFAGGDEGSALVRLLRRAYRQAVPLDVRLRLRMWLLTLLRPDRP
jgi:hypothetical protein